jgi:hypothetical protein
MMPEIPPRGICRCWYCGGEICWDSDFPADEVYGEGVSGIVTYLHCPDCGAEIEYQLLEE